MRLGKIGSGLISVLALAASIGMAHAKSDIVVAMQLEPPHLDPTSAAAGAIDSVLYSNVFEGLTRFGPDGSVNPGLAESWEISPDGKTYTFKL
ncbi:MAG: ABC transporter substrate-binding protein, partial [Roseibium sp.]|nr:ABC transporter substrate-binding protein [Roseibium sp.]